MVALASVVTADAQSAKEAQRVNQRRLAEAVATANAACGSAIVVPRVDPGPAFTATERENAVRGCRQAFEGIRLVCETQSGRAAVSSQIKRVGCGASREFPGGYKVALDRGVLTFRFNPDVPVPDQGSIMPIVAFDYLLDHLRVDGQPLYVQALRPREEKGVNNTNDLGLTNRSCGTSITVEFDWTDVPAPAIKAGRPSNDCRHALDAVKRVCADSAGREAVAKRIRRIVCGYAAERSISLRDGELVFRNVFKEYEDYRPFIFEYLQNAL
jgi:hypothetical protein